MALASKTFTQNGTFNAPAGVKSVTVVTVKNATPFSATGSQTTSFFIDPYGKLYGWGANPNGQVGIGSVANQTTARLIGGQTYPTFKAISYSGLQGYALGLSNDGMIYGWGLNSQGDLGLGDVTPRSTPTLISDNNSYQALIANRGNSGLGNGCSVALSTGGKVYVWGRNSYGVLGLGDQIPRSTPTLIGSNTFQQIAQASDLGGLALLDISGNIYTSGYNNKGQLGTNIPGGAVSTPTLVVGGYSWQAVYGTEDGYQALTTDGHLYGWGYNGSGQLGVGDFVDRSSPTIVAGGHVWGQVSVASENILGYTLALDTSGVAYGWGDNTGGTVGNNLGTFAFSTPQLVYMASVAGGGPFVKIFAGGPSFGILADGSMYAWGSNANGQLGTNEDPAVFASRSRPVLVSGGIKWQTVYTGGTQVFGVAQNGSIYAWGLNSSGQLGIGDTTPRSSPTLISGGNLAGIAPTIQTTRVPVVPGSAYSVTLDQFFAQFGLALVGRGRVDSLTVYFEQ
jgi:alpha-tubulin suppressor-like RCC1 family protein